MTKVKLRTALSSVLSISALFSACSQQADNQIKSNRSTSGHEDHEDNTFYSWAHSAGQHIGNGIDLALDFQLFSEESNKDTRSGSNNSYVYDLNAKGGMVVNYNPEKGDQDPNHQCIHGTRQSPIILNEEDALLDDSGKFNKLYYQFMPKFGSVEISHGKINGKPTNAPVVSIQNGKKYALANVHFHFKSEHKLNDKQYDGEMHMVHKNVNGDDYLVVGFLFKKDESKLAPSISFDIGAEGLGHFVGSVLDRAKTEDNNIPYFTYKGSLTTAPCSESVTWVVAEKPVSVNISINDRNLWKTFRFATPVNSNHKLIKSK